MGSMRENLAVLATAEMRLYTATNLWLAHTLGLMENMPGLWDCMPGLLVSRQDSSANMQDL